MNEIRIFIAYSKKDEALLTEFLEFIHPLVRSNNLFIWTDRSIELGDLWDKEIKSFLCKSDIIVLFLSPSFLASDYIVDVELRIAFRKWKNKTIEIAPILVRPSLLNIAICQSEPKYTINFFQYAPRNGNAVTLWKIRDEAWWDCSQQLLKLCTSILQKREDARAS